MVPLALCGAGWVGVGREGGGGGGGEGGWRGAAVVVGWLIPDIASAA